jgi:hypothetical protein
MVSSRTQPDEPFTRWMQREWLLVVITVGVGLDWLPWVMTGTDWPTLAQLSGTKLLVFPGLALAFLMRPVWILRPHRLGVAYLVTLATGGGMGWLAGNVALWRLTAIAVNGFLLLYFLKVKSLVSISRVLVITFVLSVFIPLMQWLTKLGILSGGIEQSPGVERVFSIFDTSTVGFAPLMIPACLGGLIFARARPQRNAMNALLALGVVMFGFSGGVLAAQRSAVLAYGVALLTALALYTHAHRRQSKWVLKVTGVLALVSLSAVVYFRELASSVLARFSDQSAFEDAKDLRLGGFTTFLSDLFANPFAVVPKGHQSLFDRTGVEPHLLLSEAYYEGGPLFLAAIVVILLKYALACVALVRSRDARARTIGLCLCAFGCGAAIQVTLQTALVLRLVPVILGCGIAAHQIVRNRPA